MNKAAGILILSMLILLTGCAESSEDQIWNAKVDAAIGSSDCNPVSGPKFGGNAYAGMLIDSHYHIPAISDDPFREVFDDSWPTLGVNIDIKDIACTLEQEGTSKVFAFFPVYPQIPMPMMEIASRTMQLYPERFVPFIMPPDGDNDKDGSPTVDADELREMLGTYPGLFRGYGEIGLYERKGGAKELPPDSQRLLDIYPVIRENNLAVYFHLGEGQRESFERVLEENPDINFIFHGDQLILYEEGVQYLYNIDGILSNHPNAYYTIDELYGDEWMLRPSVSKQQFLEYLENYEVLLEEDLATWKGIIERHPDQFMWGTDRSDQVLWSHDPEIGQALSNYARAFIARLSPEVQEKFAYRNAESLLK